MPPPLNATEAFIGLYISKLSIFYPKIIKNNPVTK